MQTQTIQFRVDSNYIDIVINLLNSLNGLKVNVIKDLFITKSDNESSNEDVQELTAYSNHTVNLIEEWKDSEEDNVWK